MTLEQLKARREQVRTQLQANVQFLQGQLALLDEFIAAAEANGGPPPPPENA